MSTTRPKPRTKTITLRMGASPEFGKRKRRITVRATIVGRWAWHQSYDRNDKPLPNRFTVTHVPSGLAAFVLLSQHKAPVVARLFDRLFPTASTKRVLASVVADGAWKRWAQCCAAGLYSKPPAYPPQAKA